MRDDLTKGPKEWLKWLPAVLIFQTDKAENLQQKQAHFGTFPHEPITFYDKDLELNKEARVMPIVLEVNMTK